MKLTREELQRRAAREREQMAETWSHALNAIEWTLFATLTFPHCPGEEESERAWCRWRRYVRLRLLESGAIVSAVGPFTVLNARLPRPARRFSLYSARAIEWQKRGSIHFHALLGAPVELRASLAALYRVGLAEEWRAMAGGHADIQPVHSPALVVAYLVKYVTKAGNLEVLAPRKLLVGAWSGRPAVGNTLQADKCSPD